MASLNQLPILQYQLSSYLDITTIEAIAEEVEKLTLQCYRFPGPTTNMIMQPPGHSLMIYVKNGKESSTRSLHILAPLTEATGEFMLYDSSSNSTDLDDAFDSGDEYLVGCQLVNILYQKGISIKHQVSRHKEMIDTGVVDVWLLIKKEDSGQFFIAEVFIGERLGNMK